MITATWKMPGLFKADATKVCEEIMALGNAVKPEQIVRAAEDKESELHKCFTWDDSVAAKKWRLQEARTIMCHLIIDEQKEERKDFKEIRVFHKNDDDGYKPASLVFTQNTEYEKLLAQARAELRVFKKKYSMLQELDYIFELID